METWRARTAWLYTIGSKVQTTQLTLCLLLCSLTSVLCPGSAQLEKKVHLPDGTSLTVLTYMAEALPI